MDERRDNLPQEEQTENKTQWQSTKEGWYDKVPLTVKQLDIIIGVCFALLGLTVLSITLEALGIWSLFG